MTTYNSTTWRTGNLCLHGRMVYKIREILEDHLIGVLADRESYDDEELELVTISEPEPIALAPKIMEHAGFNFTEGINPYYTFEISPILRLTGSYINRKFTVFINQNPNNTLQYVHEVQNLYHAFHRIDMQLFLVKV